MAGNHNFPEDDRIDRIIKDLQDRVADLERLTRVGTASIDNGALLVKKGDQVVAAFGDLARAGYSTIRRPDGTPQMGVLLFRDNGELAFAMWDDSPLAAPGYQQYWSWWDRAGTVIFSDDTDSGWGLANPYLPAPLWLNTDTAHWPTTTSATFVPAWDAFVRVQNPKLYIDFLMYVTAADTTGEARLIIDGTQYGPTISVTGSGYGSYNQVLSLPSNLHNLYPQVTIEYRRVSGTGSVKASPRIAYGRQT